MRQGFIRLFTVIALPWCAYWGWQFYQSSSNLRLLVPQVSDSEQSLTNLREFDKRGVTLAGDASNNEQVFAAERERIANLRGQVFEQRRDKQQAATYFTGGIIGLATALLIIGWVARGFRR